MIRRLLVAFNEHRALMANAERIRRDFYSDHQTTQLLDVLAARRIELRNEREAR